MQRLGHIFKSRKMTTGAEVGQEGGKRRRGEEGTYRCDAASAWLYEGVTADG